MRLIDALNRRLYHRKRPLWRTADVQIEKVPIPVCSLSVSNDAGMSNVEGVHIFDEFVFKIQIKDKPLTRRGLLSIVSSIYDPLGFTAPFVLSAKIVLQDLCRRSRRMNWDDAIPSDCLPSVQRWLEGLPALAQFSVRRCYKPEKFGEIASIQIHHFSDASELAYGTVSYMRLTSEDGRVSCSFLLSKSRLAPLKALSIPRLELNAATLAVKLDRMFRKELELPITSSVFWTGSTSVLRYIRNNDKRFHTFVSNRLTVIHDGSSVDQWRYVDSKRNPSDVTTRGLSAKALLSDERWKQGPQFLWLEESSWPRFPASLETSSQDDLEIKEHKRVCSVQLKNLAQPDDKVFAYYSSWYKLQRSVAYLLRYKTWLLNKVRSKFGQPIAQVPSGKVTLTEMKNGEREILMSLQRKFFPKELKQLSKYGQSDRTKSVNKSSSISRLDPILKNGLLLVGGRLRHTTIQAEARNPIILPKKSHVVDLIVRNCHEVFGHVGREHVLSLLREKFWLVKGRATVRRVLNACFSCRKRNQLPMTQKMADLPHERVASQEPPFTYAVAVWRNVTECFSPA